MLIVSISFSLVGAKSERDNSFRDVFHLTIEAFSLCWAGRDVPYDPCVLDREWILGLVVVSILTKSKCGRESVYYARRKIWEVR